ncbi:hypothetical protein Y032_0523g2912 [Ancylostoma ceylanicum]|uniref:Uncharacterized protein n=1 Tax=Ancylostoma ceylanicum TaxID=53326 RepID=A0A016WSK7_9BILA|nr:hypothetical protein Y032_0523g2912 [Ancylostoma ceylanicum]
MIKIIQELVKTAYSLENWSFVTVRPRGRKDEMLEMDTRVILGFMTATCRKNNILLAVNFTQLMMPSFVSVL